MPLIELLHMRLLFVAVGALISTWVGWIVVGDMRKRRKYRYPPIVPGLPLVGNTFQFPKVNQGPYLQKLAQQYGEMLVTTISTKDLTHGQGL